VRSATSTPSAPGELGRTVQCGSRIVQKTVDGARGESLREAAPPREDVARGELRERQIRELGIAGHVLFQAAICVSSRAPRDAPSVPFTYASTALRTVGLPPSPVSAAPAFGNCFLAQAGASETADRWTARRPLPRDHPLRRATRRVSCGDESLRSPCV
jgi:hypothetical protein